MLGEDEYATMVLGIGIVSPVNDSSLLEGVLNDNYDDNDDVVTMMDDTRS